MAYFIFSKSPAGDRISGFFKADSLRSDLFFTCLCPSFLCTLTVAIVFAIGFGKQVRTVRHSHIIVIIMVVRMGCGIKRIVTGITDRAGRKSFVFIEVVRAIQFLICIGQFVVVTNGILQRSINLQIREFAAVAQTVMNNA